jgi:S1-C subfamily serine protease
MLRKILCTLAFLFALNAGGFAQQTGKIFFDKNGKKSNPEVGYYYRLSKDSSGFFKSYYVANDKLYFSGRLSQVSDSDESQNLYSGTCRWYYRNGNPKAVRNFSENGKENGLTTYYYESGQTWKEIEYENGHIKGNTYTEFNEDGGSNRIFEENFTDNFNEWDLYESEKSTSNITGGKLIVKSHTREGTSRYLNHTVDADEYTIELHMDGLTLKETGQSGLIYGFKDWQNYHYFAINKKSIYLGSYYEGVKTQYVDAMYCNSINAVGNNIIKIICDGEKAYFSVNGEIQYKQDRSRLFGNNFGVITGGISQIQADKLIIKEINVKGQTRRNPSSGDRDVKATGSGVIFSSNGYILTNYHVVDKANRYIIEMSDNGNKKEFNADLIIQDKENDLAILKIKDGEFSSLPLLYAFKESGPVEVGSTVFTIGFPHALSGMGKDAKFTDGKVSSKTGYNGNINSFQTTIPVQPGNSGGPVFNNDGQLIGVINATFKEADNVSYAIKLNYIRNLIELLSEKVDPPVNNTIQALPLEEKLKVLTNYVVLIKVK